MATIKSYTDLEQSKKLAEILPLDSADMRYGYIAPYDYSDRMFDGGYDEVPYPKDFLKRNQNFSENEYDGEFPCWSIAALLDVLQGYALINNGFNEKTALWYKGNSVECNNPVDACYKLILKLNELNLL